MHLHLSIMCFIEIDILNCVIRQFVAFYSGKISSWIDLDSDDETLRIDSETTLKQEISWASHLSLQVCFVIT